MDSGGFRIPVKMLQKKPSAEKDKQTPKKTTLFAPIQPHVTEFGVTLVDALRCAN